MWNGPKRRGVAFRVLGSTCVDADDSLQIWRLDKRDALRHDAFNTLGLNEPPIVPRQQGAAAARVFSPIYVVDQFLILRPDALNAAPLRSVWLNTIRRGTVISHQAELAFSPFTFPLPIPSKIWPFSFWLSAICYWLFAKRYDRKNIVRTHGT